MKRTISCLVALFLIIGLFSQFNISGAYENKSEEMSAAIRLKGLEVLKGTNKGFELDENTTRLEGLIVIIRLLGKEEDTNLYENRECVFSDVPQWGVKYVNYAFDNKITKGLNEKTFGSNQEISGKEYITFLLRVLKYSDSEGDFSFDRAIEKAVSLGLVKKSESDGYAGSFTRGSLAILSSRALDMPFKSGGEKLISSIERLGASYDERGVSVCQLGATGDGKTDDTAAIQAALNKYDRVYIPNGVYMIDGLKGLRPKSNQVITLDKYAVLKIISNSSPFYFMFYISNVSNTVIQGGTIAGDRNSHTGTAGETGVGVNIAGNNRSITVKNMKIQDFWGDAINIGDEQISKDIQLEGVICSNNRRQGLSISNSTNISIKDSLFETANGIGSQAGIYIDGKPGEVLKDISISNTWAINNKGGGIFIDGSESEISAIEITNCRFSNNDLGLYLSTCKDISVYNTYFTGNKNNGMELARDIIGAEFCEVSATDNGLRGASIVVLNQKEGTRDINFNKCVFKNNGKSAKAEYDGVRIDNYDSSLTVRNIRFTECSFIDDQSVATQRYGITVAQTDKVSDIIVGTNCVFKGNAKKDMILNNAGSVQAPPNLEGYLSVKNTGAAGDSVTDDTQAIQRALDGASEIVIPKGVYMINTKAGLKVRSDTTIVFEQGAVLKAISSNEPFYRILIIDNVSNVKISGGHFIGDRYGWHSKDSEWGTGVFICDGARNIVVENAVFEEFMGDGVYIGGSPVPYDIKIDSVWSSNNLRSGMSITSANNVVVSNSVFCGSNGTEPSTGISIEPNKNDICENITIKNSKLTGNDGNGINILGINGDIRNIKISSCDISENRDGIYIDNCNNITVENSDIKDNKNIGLNIDRDAINGNFYNLVISRNYFAGASLITAEQRTGLVDLIFKSCTFSNNGFSRPNTTDGVRIGPADSTGVIQNIKIQGCSFIDDQQTPTQRYGITLHTGGKTLDVYIENTCEFWGNIKGGIKYF